MSEEKVLLFESREPIRQYFSDFTASNGDTFFEWRIFEGKVQYRYEYSAWAPEDREVQLLYQRYLAKVIVDLEDGEAGKILSSG